jgi:hypothetical protein
MIMPCHSGSECSRGLPERAAPERLCAWASAAGNMCVRSRAPGTLGTPGGHARVAQVRADVPS